MNLKELIEILKTTGFEVAYDHFQMDEPPICPYLTVEVTNTANSYADNRVYMPFAHYEVQLCNDKKDPTAEKKLTDVLDAEKICWQMTNEDYFNTDGLYVNYYEFEEVIN